MFVFESKTHNKDCLILFLGQYDYVASNSLPSSIQDAYLVNLTPEIVFFIYPLYLKSDVDEFLTRPASQLDLTRNKFSPVICLSFDVRGNFSETHRFNVPSLGLEGLEIDFDQLSADIIRDGYAHLMQMRSNDVLVKAPAGTTFVKPSGKTLEEFIYASQLARTNFEYQFLAMSLLKHSPDSEKIDSIFIDTSSISTIAESVIYYITRFLMKKCKHITYKSFSSYSGLEKEVKPDNPDGAWVIISASATTSMGKKLVKDWNLRSNQVVTILSYSPILTAGDRNNGNSVVFCLDAYSNRDKESFSPIKVQVQGESFSAEVSNPQKALLLKKHKPHYVDECIYKYIGKNVFSLNKKEYKLHVDYINLRKAYLSAESNLEGKLFDWIKQVVQWTIPRNLNTIIVKSDPTEQQLLRDFQDVLLKCGFDLTAINVITPDEHAKMQVIEECAVLVISSVVSTARFFIDINRELRLAKHKGMRIFAAPYVVSPSQSTYEKLQTSLTQGTNNFKYSFVSFNKIYVGSKNLSSWKKELELIKKLINQFPENPEGADFWDGRKSILEKGGEGLYSKVGINYSNNNSLLELAPDFVFWPTGYTATDLDAVYATVSSILQNLRDNQFDGYKLSANIYQHCVIDPENFVRFNDSILQSCLWRCALPGELDYRRSDDLSNDMQRILRKIFMAANSSRGVTALDLLIGLGTRWIKISNEAMALVLKDAEEYLKEPHATLLIDFLKSEFTNSN